MLEKALAGETDPDVRVEMLYKLNQSGSYLALQQFVASLHDPDPKVVVTAINILQEWDDEELLERYVQPLAEHDDEDIRGAVREAFASFD